jgi:hypothetical protein
MKKSDSSQLIDNVRFYREMKCLGWVMPVNERPSKVLCVNHFYVVFFFPVLHVQFEMNEMTTSWQSTGILLMISVKLV